MACSPPNETPTAPATSSIALSPGDGRPQSSMPVTQYGVVAVGVVVKRAFGR